MVKLAIRKLENCNSTHSIGLWDRVATNVIFYQFLIRILTFTTFYTLSRCAEVETSLSVQHIILPTVQIELSRYTL